MATLQYGFVSACQGGGHTHLDVTLGGVGTQRFTYTMDDLLRPLSALTQDERELVALVLLKIGLTGMTRQEARAKLERPGGYLVVV